MKYQMSENLSDKKQELSSFTDQVTPKTMIAKFSKTYETESSNHEILIAATRHLVIGYVNDHNKVPLDTLIALRDGFKGTIEALSEEGIKAKGNMTLLTINDSLDNLKYQIEVSGRLFDVENSTFIDTDNCIRALVSQYSPKLLQKRNAQSAVLAICEQSIVICNGWIRNFERKK
jgi:hypothetical protein